MMGCAFLLVATLLVIDAAQRWTFSPVEPVEAAISLEADPLQCGNQPTSLQVNCSPAPVRPPTKPAVGKQPASVSCPCEGCKDCESRLNDARKDLEARIDKDRQDAGDRIDKWMGLNEWFLALVITVFGFLLPLIGGIAAYMNVKTVRDEAKEQLGIIRARVKDIQKDYEREVTNARKEAKEQIEEIKREYQDNFPQFSAMDARMQRLLSEMKLRMPSEDDFNDAGLFPKMPEIDRQYILDSELTVAAISVFGLGQSPSLRARISSIYGTLARFYNLRDNTFKNLAESDFVRAVSYATRVIDLNRDSSEGYRMRGAIYLDRYRLLKEVLKSTDEKKLKDLLDSAEMDLDEAIGKSTSEAVDAGAFYNRALAHYYRYKDKRDKGEIEKAVTVSKRLLGLKSKITAFHREKYLPSIYLNLGSFLAELAVRARGDNQPDAERQFSTEAVQAITEGFRDFEKTTMQDMGLARLKKELEGELVGEGELSKLENTYVQQLWALVRGTPGKEAHQSPGEVS
jgi:hypothetical protein